MLFSLKIALERRSRHGTIRSIKQSLPVFPIASETLPVFTALTLVAALCWVLVKGCFELMVTSHYWLKWASFNNITSPG